MIGDVNTQNILVNSQAAVSIIDTDSFQVRNPDTNKLFRCPVGSPGFTPVELLKQKPDFSLIDRSEIHDRFGLATIIYLLIFCGNQPYSGRWKGRTEPPLDQNGWVEAGAWPYSKNSPVEIAANSVPLRIVHPGLQRCFLRAFGAGHVRPEHRPTATEWYDALSIASAALKQCPKESSHWFDSTNSACYWCERKSATGYDYFPPTPVHQKIPVSKLSLNFLKKQKLPTGKSSPTIPQKQKAPISHSSTALGQTKIQASAPAPVLQNIGRSKKNNFQTLGRIARSDLARLSSVIIIGYLWGVHTLRWSGDDFVSLMQIFIHSTYLIIISLFVIFERRIMDSLPVPNWILTNHRWVQLVMFATIAALYGALSKFYHFKPTFFYDIYFLAILMLLVFAYRNFKIGLILLLLIYFCAFSHFLLLIPLLIPSDVTGFDLKVASAALGCILLSVIVSFSNPHSNIKSIVSKGFKTQGLTLPAGAYGSYIIDAVGTAIIMSAIIWYLITASIIPPVPIHVRYSGIFYNVEKVYSSDGDYYYSLKKLSPPWYKFWQNNTFHLRRAFDRYDKIYSFVAVFAPYSLPNSKNNQYIRLTQKWDFFSAKTKEWITKRKFNWKMKGGRWGGWRTYEYIDATDIEPGLWRIRILTSEGHLVGKIVFRITQGYGKSWNFNNHIY